MRDEVDEARADVERAVELDSENPENYEARADFFDHIGDAARAAEDRAAAERLDTESNK